MTNHQPTPEEIAVEDLMCYVKELTGGTEPIHPPTVSGDIRSRPGYHLAYAVRQQILARWIGEAA